MSEELKPCPFCGRNVKIENIGDTDSNEKIYMIFCDCGASVTFAGSDEGEEGSYDLNKKESIAAWNRRVEQ